MSDALPQPPLYPVEYNCVFHYVSDDTTQNTNLIPENGDRKFFLKATIKIEIALQFKS
jgi:hypothetical protein